MKYARYVDGSFIVLLTDLKSREFYKELDFIKKHPLSRFDPKKRRYHFPACEYIKNTFEERGYEVPFQFNKKNFEFKYDTPIDPFPFQKEALDFLEGRGGNTLLALDMGLGKTIVTLLYLWNHPELLPAMVVCPAGVKYNWEVEAERVGFERTFVLSGQKSKPLPESDLFICNYNILQHRKKELIEQSLGLCVADEAHRLKNPNAKRAKAFKEISSNTSSLLLTGTPILNNHGDVYHLSKLVDRNLFPKYKDFCRKFYPEVYNKNIGCVVHPKSTNGDMLYEILTGSIMYRKHKQEVITELPQVNFLPIHFQLDNKEDYEAIIDEMSKLDPKDDKYQLRKLALKEQLFYTSAIGKLSSSGDYIDDLITEGKRPVVFTRHTDVADLLSKRTSFPRIDGSVSSKKKQETVEEFQSKKHNGIIVNLQSGSEGLNVQSADCIVFVEYPWTSSSLEQCISRVNRIGQKAEQIDVFFLIGSEVEKYQINKIKKKKEVIDLAIEDGLKTFMDGLYDI